MMGSALIQLGNHMAINVGASFAGIFEWEIAMEVKLQMPLTTIALIAEIGRQFSRMNLGEGGFALNFDASFLPIIRLILPHPKPVIESIRKEKISPK